MIIRLRVGWETLVIGPRANFSGLLDSNPSTGDPLASAEDLQRRLVVALHDPAISGQLRTAIGRWTGDAYRIQATSDWQVIVRVAHMARGGYLVAFVVPEPAMKARRDDIGALEAQALSDATKPATVNAMSLEERIKATLLLTPRHLVGAGREKFTALLDPKSINLTVGVLSIWTTSHFSSLGEIVDAFMLIATFFATGSGVWGAAKKIRLALDTIVRAASEDDLNEAAKCIAQAVDGLGVDALARAFRHGASKRASKWKAPKPSVRRAPQEPAPGMHPRGIG